MEYRELSRRVERAYGGNRARFMDQTYSCQVMQEAEDRTGDHPRGSCSHNQEPTERELGVEMK